MQKFISLMISPTTFSNMGTISKIPIPRRPQSFSRQSIELRKHSREILLDDSNVFSANKEWRMKVKRDFLIVFKYNQFIFLSLHSRNEQTHDEAPEWTAILLPSKQGTNPAERDYKSLHPSRDVVEQLHKNVTPLNYSPQNRTGKCIQHQLRHPGLFWFAITQTQNRSKVIRKYQKNICKYKICVNK